jgi:hypothetical protein
LAESSRLEETDDVAVCVFHGCDQLAWVARPVLVNGAAGAVWAPGGRPRVVFAFTIADRKVVAIDLLAEPERIGRLDLKFLDTV